MIRPDFCVHFNGLGIGARGEGKRCRAGVRYLDVRDDSDGARRWPCMPPLGQRLPCTTTCEHKRLPTAEEVAAFEVETRAVVDEALAKIARGECHWCGAKVERRRQIGRCQYAEPCGHRIGQVDAGDEP